MARKRSITSPFDFLLKNLQVTKIELRGLMLANAVILGEITVEGSTVVQLIGNDAPIAQHTIL